MSKKFISILGAKLTMIWESP